MVGVLGESKWTWEEFETLGRVVVVVVVVDVLVYCP